MAAGNDTIHHHVMENVTKVVEWMANKSSICYTETIGTETSTTWCGDKHVCSMKGLLLPIFVEVRHALKKVKIPRKRKPIKVLDILYQYCRKH